MVKLFIGNLASTVDSIQLKELFTGFASVQECDVLKNYAFVHVGNEDEADTVLKNLDNYVLEGRPIHIERSTSRLRKDPGMAAVCFRCGSTEHKTPSCPLDKAEDSVRRGHRKMDSPSTNGSKRSQPREDPYYPPAKRLGESHYPPSYDYRSYSYYGPTSAPPAYGPPRPDDYYSRPAAPPRDYFPGPPSGFIDPGTRERYDPVLPSPTARELENLYGQYVDSRQRYFYYRDQLFKEMMARGESVTATTAANAQYANAQYGAQPPAQNPVVRYPDMYYSQRPAAPAGAAPYIKTEPPSSYTYPTPGYTAPAPTTAQPSYVSPYAAPGPPYS